MFIFYWGIDVLLRVYFKNWFLNTLNIAFCFSKRDSFKYNYIFYENNMNLFYRKCEQHIKNINKEINPYNPTAQTENFW